LVNSSSLLQTQLHRIAQLRGHVHQRVKREFLRAAFHEIVHARLRDAGELGGFGLGDAQFDDDAANVD
jgi:hypothetical protein